MRPFAGLLPLALLALGFTIAGCGGGDRDRSATAAAACPPTTGASTKTTTLENPAAGGDYAFEKDSLTAPAGRITLVMKNPSREVHNIAVEGNHVDVKGELAGRGETSRVTVMLEPGEYTFYCSVPLHQNAGMDGTLTVTS